MVVPGWWTTLSKRGIDYYPFGLTYNNFKRENSVKNRYLFNGGSELQGALGWYQTAYRMYDPTLGRFHGIDALTDIFPDISPMTFGYNNPLLFNDPTGLFGTLCPDCGDDITYDLGKLPMITITPKGSNNRWSNEFNQWDYGGTYSQYQKQYPQFSGMSQTAATNHRQLLYSEGFFDKWNAAVKKERDIIAINKMAWFAQGFVTAGSMGMGAFRTSLASPKTFQYLPKVNSPSSISTMESLGFQKLSSFDDVAGTPGVYHFNHAFRRALGYTGQSGDIGFRLSTHNSLGNIGSGQIWFKPILNSSRLQREVFETTIILRLGKGSLNNTANLRFPVIGLRASKLGLDIY